jgi:hypothetical protein
VCVYVCVCVCVYVCMYVCMSVCVYGFNTCIEKGMGMGMGLLRRCNIVKEGLISHIHIIHISHNKRITYHIHISHITYHISHITYHTSRITYIPPTPMKNMHTTTQSVISMVILDWTSVKEREIEIDR